MGGEKGPEVLKMSRNIWIDSSEFFK